MDENPQIITSPDVDSAPEQKKSEGSKTTLIILGVVVLLVVFIGAIFVLTYSGDSENAGTVTNQQSSGTINSDADLNKVEGELDSENLDSYEAELNQNETDSSEF